MEVIPVAELVRTAEHLDKSGVTTSSKYVMESMRDDINLTEAYINSKHKSGPVDYMGREKPFFNIVQAARNIWYRATVIQRKNIMIRASKASDEILAFIATIKFQQWMKDTQFAKFLNEWGLVLATHGAAIVQFIELDGQLHCKVEDWNQMIVDAIDFKSGLKIKKLWYTPAGLKKKKGYDKKFVDLLLNNLQTRQTVDRFKKDNKVGYIPVYEVYGELPLSLITDDPKDDEDFSEQMHVISFVAEKPRDKKDGSKKFADYTLFRSTLPKSPFMLTSLIKKDGVTYPGGAVKNLFEAQWMVNHSEKQIKDKLDLACRTIYQTQDAAFAGQNVLTNVEVGDILIHSNSSPLTMLQGDNAIESMQSARKDWLEIGNQINGISEAMQGQAPASGTAWRLLQAQLQENHDLFELMTENKGLDLIDMMTDFILPFFKKQLNNKDEVSMILEDHQIKQIDSRYVPNEIIRRVNQKKLDTILSGQIYDPTQEAQDAASAQQYVMSQLMGSQRFIKPDDVDSKTWKAVFADFEWKLDLDVTEESEDVQGILATLTTVLQTLATNPGVLQDPNMKMIFSRILSLSGAISPIEIQTTQAQPAMPPQQPAQPNQPPQPAQAMAGAVPGGGQAPPPVLGQ